jgi:MFS family permease
MKLFNHHHNRKLYSFIHSDLWNFELSVWLHMIGWSVTSIFIPILMLSAGYSLTMVMVYYAIFNLVDTPLNFFAAKLTKDFGAKIVIVAGTLLAILFFWFLNRLNIHSGFSGLVVLAFLAALYDTFYWVAHFYLFIESSGEGKSISRNTGILNGIESLAGMLGPAIGAGILLFTHTSVLLTVSIIFLVLSILPLLRLRHPKNKPEGKKISFKEFFKELPEKKNFLSWFLYSMHLGVENIIWPIFIFTLFGTLKSIALVAVIISVSKILLSYISGIVNIEKREKLMGVGILATLLIWILRLKYPHPVFYYLSILLVGLFSVMIEVPLDSNVFERARLKDRGLATSTYFNVTVMFSQGILFTLLALFLAVFKISFFLAIASLLLLLLVNQFILYFKKEKIYGDS